MLKVFFAEFQGHYLCGHATIVAESIEQARELLLAEMKHDSGEYLIDRNKDKRAIRIVEIDTSKVAVVDFDNGDY